MIAKISPLSQLSYNILEYHYQCAWQKNLFTNALVGYTPVAALGLGFDDDVHPATITIAATRAKATNMWYFFIFPSPTEVF